MTERLSELEHLSGYQSRDHEVVDYQLYTLPGTRLTFRGPADARAVESPAITCLGAAQTFGCFTARPFPALLARATGVPVLNLGYGGAGPRFYLRHPDLLDRANRSQAVVVQVMSGRSESNSLFDSGGLEYLVRRSDGQRFGASAAYREILHGPQRQGLTSRVLGRLHSITNAPRARRIVAETRRNWVASYHELFDALTVPTLLLWFSQREPDYTEGYRSVSGLFSDFPQLVNRAMLDDIAARADGLVRCTTSAGMPQPLVSRFTGQPVEVDPADDRADLGGRTWTHNTYYPSPQMHEAAAAALLPTCRSLLSL